MKQTLAILTEGENPAVDWIGLFKNRNCKLLICTDCTYEGEHKTEHLSGETVSYQPCAKDAAWEADLLLIETGLTPLSKLLPRVSSVAANKIVLLHAISPTDEFAIANKLVEGLPYSTIGLLKLRDDDFEIHLFNNYHLEQAKSILQELNFPFLVNTKNNEQDYQK